MITGKRSNKKAGTLFSLSYSSSTIQERQMFQLLKGFEMFITTIFFTEQLNATIWDVEDEDFEP